MAPDFVWKRGDTGSALMPTLTYAERRLGNGGFYWRPMDLTGATVTLTMAVKDGAAPVLDNVGVAVVGDPKAGVISYTPSDGAATAVSGFYVAEFKVIDQFAKTWYWPNPRPFYIQIAERVAI